jgi:hypothetical protein|tara:strand:+ start:6476 stop:7024 length:549 start_codon:yes stop_codon:yes gene_type:complete
MSKVRYSAETKALVVKNYKEGRQKEKEFAKVLTDVHWSSTKEDIHDHWDVEGRLPPECGLEGRFKFDVKGIKRFNAYDSTTQDKLAWIESKNPIGRKGWLVGEADYIAFERPLTWLVVNRVELLHLVNDKVKSLGYKKGKKPYHIYGRVGRLDKLTLAPFKDLEDLSLTKEILKDKSNEVHS